MSNTSFVSATNQTIIPVGALPRVRANAPVTFVTNTAASAPLRWADLESRDYKQYAANLRAAGVPEQVVRDIIAADIGKAYGPRLAELRGSAQESKYWQRYRQPELTAEQKTQLKALDDEKRAALKAVLGEEISSQGLVDLFFLQVRNDVSATGFLSEDKRDAARAAIERADREFEMAEMDSRDWMKRQREQTRLRVKEMEKILTPEELDEFKLRQSDVADRVRGELRDFQVTPEEFRAIVEVKETLQKEQETRAPHQTAQKREAMKLTEALGAERYADYARGTDLAWLNARQIAEREGLAPDAADKVYAAKLATDATLERIRGDRTLDSTQRREQIDAAKSAAEQSVRSALGESGFNRYKNRGGIWIGNIR